MQLGRPYSQAFFDRRLSALANMGRERGRPCPKGVGDELEEDLHRTCGDRKEEDVENREGLR